MARYLFSQGCFLSAIYCGGYSGEDPPLPIPNREVKLTIADGTAPPGGRVGSCRSSGLRSTHVDRSLFLCPIVQSLTPKGKVVRKLTLRTTSPFGCTSPAHPGLHRRWPLVNYFRTPGVLLPHPALQLVENQDLGKRPVEVATKFSCYFHTLIFPPLQHADN